MSNKQDKSIIKGTEAGSPPYASPESVLQILEKLNAEAKYRAETEKQSLEITREENKLLTGIIGALGGYGYGKHRSDKEKAQ